MKKKSKLKSILSIVILITIAMLVLYTSLKDNYKEIINGLLSANKLWILVAILFVFGYWFFKSIIFDFKSIPLWSQAIPIFILSPILFYNKKTKLSINVIIIIGEIYEQNTFWNI